MEYKKTLSLGKQISNAIPFPPYELVSHHHRLRPEDGGGLRRFQNAAHAAPDHQVGRGLRRVLRAGDDRHSSLINLI